MLEVRRCLGASGGAFSQSPRAEGAYSRPRGCWSRPADSASRRIGQRPGTDQAAECTRLAHVGSLGRVARADRRARGTANDGCGMASATPVPGRGWSSGVQWSEGPGWCVTYSVRVLKPTQTLSSLAEWRWHTQWCPLDGRIGRTITVSPASTRNLGIIFRTFAFRTTNSVGDSLDGEAASLTIFGRDNRLITSTAPAGN